MRGHLCVTWEASVGVESEVAQLRRGDPNALSLLLHAVSTVWQPPAAAQILHCLYPA
jgi:hypothetical protein